MIFFFLHLFSFFSALPFVFFSFRKGEDILDTAVYGAQTNTQFPTDQTQQEIDKVLHTYGEHAIGKSPDSVCVLSVS